LPGRCVVAVVEDMQRVARRGLRGPLAFVVAAPGMSGGERPASADGEHSLHVRHPPHRRSGSRQPERRWQHTLADQAPDGRGGPSMSRATVPIFPASGSTSVERCMPVSKPSYGQARHCTVLWDYRVCPTHFFTFPDRAGFASFGPSFVRSQGRRFFPWQLFWLVPLCGGRDAPAQAVGPYPSKGSSIQRYNQS
jgi:hypothetical protein